MTTLALKLTLPQQLAKQAKAAGPLTPCAITSMLREQLRRPAGKALQVMMDKLADANYPEMGEESAARGPKAGEFVVKYAKFHRPRQSHPGLMLWQEGDHRREHDEPVATPAAGAGVTAP